MENLKLRQAPVSVFSASAGAGKTYRLVAEYIATALSDVNNPRIFAKILALTFTNKAANEMKRRVLETLKEFSENEDLGLAADIGKTIKQIIGISEPELVFRSRIVLKEMLHDYGSIAIGTLDQFTHRLVRTFAIELGLPGKFDVEIDQGLLLDLAVNRLLQDIGKNNSLTTLLLQFSESNIDSEKNADIFPALLEMAKQLPKEKSMVPMRALESWSLEQHKNAQKSLEKLEKHFKDLAKATSHNLQETLDQIPNEIIYHFDWWNGLIKRLKLQDPGGWVPSKSMMEMTLDSLRIIKKPFLDQADIYSEVLIHLSDELLKIEELCAKAIFLNEIRRNDRTTSVLAELSKKLELIFNESNLQPLWKFNQLINDELQSQPALYIFERIGERYNYFFIDEAQDTSELQWKNLWPLLENSTADETSLGGIMIVGDAKQSIYRWRGSDAEEFLKLVETSELKIAPNINIPSLDGRTEHIALSDNWRSRTNIVEFNNYLFSGIAESGEFPRPTHTKAYQESRQNPKGLIGGRIDIRIFPVVNGPDKLSNQLNTLVQDIKSAQKESWTLGEMAILVRTKKEGRAVAIRMAEESIEIVSSELLALSSSKYVLAITSLLSWMSLPREKERQWEFLLAIYEAKIWTANIESLHLEGEAISDNTGNGFKSLIKEILPKFDINIAWQLGLYEIGEYIIRAFGVADKADPFVISFLDKLHDFALKKGNYISAFLEEWERKKSDWSISSPEGVDAIELLTIHKSKGLEFPLVFVPFTSFSVKDDRKEWFNLEYDTIFGLDQDSPPVALLSLKSFKKNPVLKSALKGISAEYVERSLGSVEERIFDDVNLLYVAFTRPKDGLTIYLDQSTYGKMIIQQIEKKHNFIDDHLVLGSWPKKNGLGNKKLNNSSMKLTSSSSEDWTSRVRLAKKEDFGIEQRIGNSVHRVLERIRHPEDLMSALKLTNIEFQWNNEEYNLVLNRVNLVINDIRLNKLFDAEEVYSERPLLIPGNAVYRPDRLVKCFDGTWLVVDYKTGEHNDKYIVKIKDYANKLEPMLGSLPKTMLLYLRDKIEIYEN